MISNRLQECYDIGDIDEVVSFLVENQIEVNTLLELHHQIIKYFGRCRPTLSIDHNIEEIVICVPIKDMSVEEVFERINKFDEGYFLKLPTKIFGKICVVPRFC